MRRIIIIFVALCVIGWPAAVRAQEPATGDIVGQVVNGTEGGGSVAGVEVTLITYVDDMISDTTTTIADEDGKFRFSDVVREHAYLVMAKYMDVGYYYPVAFESGEETASVEVGVCDVTDSDRAISVDLAHTVINVAGDSLKITAVYRLYNDGDRTYVGAYGSPVFTLPGGAFGFEAPQELVTDYELLEDNRVAYLVPFPPGERQLVYAYSLARPDEAEFTVPLTIDYPTESLELMIAGEDIEVSLNELAPADPVVNDAGERFIHFQGKDLRRGAVVNVRLSGPHGDGGFPLYIIWIIIAVLAIGIAVYLMSRRKKAGGDE
jgi:hypothetical protein